MKLFRIAYLPAMAGFFLALLCTFGFAAEPSETQPQAQIESNQHLFEQAISLVNQGKYAEGAEMLGGLYQRTHAPRVKLEWARALYLADKKQEAKILFKEVLDTNPPYMVKEKIHVFLDDISKDDGKFDISFGVMRDSNPKAVTSASTVNIFGQQYNYNPNAKAETETGLSYDINASKAFNEHSPWDVGLSINGSQFNDYQYDQTNVEESISHKILDFPRVFLTFGLEEYFYAGKLLYTYPAVSLKHTYENPTGFYLWDEAKVGKLDYSDYTYLSGRIENVSTGVGKALTPQFSLGLELGADRMEANETPYSFLSGTIGLVSNFFLPTAELKVQIKVSRSYKNFDAMDPVFGETRKDDGSGLFATLTKTNWSIHDVTPSLELGIEKNVSTINIYTYKRVTANLYFRKSF